MLFMNRNSGFFNRLLPSPRPSLAARAVQSHRERGHIGCFPGFQFPTQAYGKMRFSKILNRLLQVGDAGGAFFQLRRLGFLHEVAGEEGGNSILVVAAGVCGVNLR